MIIAGDLGFIHIPKCAGTSIRQALFLATQCHYVGKVIDPEADIKDPVNQFNAHFNPAEIAPLISHLKLFTCVRNPWDRLASWYSSKKQLRTFEEFVKLVYGISDEGSLRNPNIPANNPSQGSYFEGLFFHEVLRFEDVSYGWKSKIQPLLPRSVSLEQLNTSNHKPYTDFSWTPELIDLVRDKENYVIENFDYEFGE